MSIDPRIESAAAEWLKAGHGNKRAIVERLAAEVGRSPQTVYRQLSKLVAGARQRKRRADAGKTSLTADEALALAALREETRRQTGTGVLPMQDAVEIARTNGIITAARLDPTTGELKPVSLSTVRRALRKHYVHESQLAASSPAARLSSPHPNYLWQIDASISSQYYLAEDGLTPMPKAEFYSGKPQNFERISNRRLWRYVVTDHASGAFEVFYVLGAESAANLASALLHAMSRRPGCTMHGVPKRLMADPGSAVIASTTRNLLDALGIELIINEVGNARAKGQVENAHYIVETHFEARLALTARMTSLEQINKLAQDWSRAFNATRIHSRTGMTRRNAWLRITSDQLIEAPPIDAMRQLLNSAPQTCTVRDCMIHFRSKTYDVRDVPGLINGDKVQVVVNALDSNSVRVLVEAADGTRTHYIAPCVERDSFGFLTTAARVGEEFKAPPQTPADAAGKELERIAMEVRTGAEAKAARKAKRLPFGGRVDPMKDVRELQIPQALPRASTPARVDVPNVVDLTVPKPQWDEPKREFPRYSIVDAARSLIPLLANRGVEWTAAMMEETQARYPDGVPYDEIEQWAEQLWQRHRLRVVQPELKENIA
jgi:transposase InsO family protein